MKLVEAIDQLGEAAYWIAEVAGETEAKRPHIKKMIKGLEYAKDILTKEL